MKYRPEIDGLRALAVVPVILFHLNVKSFSGGYVGVDIFFVISGFLITSIIKNEMDANKFSILNFYERRLRRILPALFLVLILSTIFSWILLPPFEFIKFHKSLLSVLFFFSNIFFWRDGDYFVTDSITKPLIHTWSLSLEEQFYLFFPFLLIFISKLNNKSITKILTAISLISLSICIIGSIYFKSANFYLLTSRFWELMIGAIGAILIQNVKNVAKWYFDYLGLLGIGLILGAIIFMDEFTPFPSIYSLIPTMGAFLVIIFANKDNKIGKVLSNKYLSRIGILSYGAYLFHQPIISFFLIFTQQEFSTSSKISIFLITFLSANLSLKFIELPIKNEKITQKQFFFVSIMIVFLMSIYSLYIFKFDNFPFEYRLAENLTKNKVITLSNLDERKFSKFRLEFLNSNPEILVLGSSRIMQVSSHYLKKEILNLAVSGASIEDQITLGILSLQKFTPKIVYLAADPWLFNKNSGQTRFQSINKEYFNSLQLILSKLDTKSGFNKNLEFDSISLVLRIYERINLNHLEQKSIDDNPGVYDKIRYDGSRIYNTKYQNLSLAKIRLGFDDLYSYSMSNYIFDNQSFYFYKKFIDFLKFKGIKVVLVFSPYHPELFKRINLNKSFNLAKNKFFELSKEKSISVIGSYDPFECNCNQYDFFDGMHPKDNCMNNILINSKTYK